MAYDLISPNGPKALGVVTDAERFAHQKLMDAQRMALADAAAKAGGGAAPVDGGPDFGNGPDFSFEHGPKETGAVDLASRNAMVDMRQQATRQVEDAANIAKGYTPGYERKLNQMKGEDAIKRESQQEALRDLLNQRTQGMFGGAAGAGAAAPGATSIPMPSPGQGNPNALVGPDNSGGPAAPAGRGHMSEDDMLELQMLGSLANGGAAPDITGAMNKRAERDQNAQKFALEIQKAKIEMENAKRAAAATQAGTFLDAGDPKSAADIAAKNGIAKPGGTVEDYTMQHPELFATLADKTAKFVKQDSAFFGRDPNNQDMESLLDERDRTAKYLIRRGYDKKEAYGEADRAMDNALGPNRNDFNADYTKNLLYRREQRNKAAGVSKFGPPL
jgi:hypothetical protein